jgi:hypothetical protein
VDQEDCLLATVQKSPCHPAVIPRTSLAPLYLESAESRSVRADRFSNRR